MNYVGLLGLLASVVQPAVGAVAMAASASSELRYRREFEQEADYMGVGYLRQAGYDVVAMSSFFEKLAADQRTVDFSDNLADRDRLLEPGLEAQWCRGSWRGAPLRHCASWPSRFGCP